MYLVHHLFKRVLNIQFLFVYATNICGIFATSNNNIAYKIMRVLVGIVILFLVSILQTAHLWANTGVVFRELSFSRL